MGDQRLQLRGVALRDGGFELLQGDAEMRGLGQYLLGIGQENIAPNGRVASGNARKISETRACQLQKCRRLGLLQQAIHLGERQQMRHMAHGGESLVVRFGRHAVNPAAQGLPQRRGGGDLHRRVVVQGRQDECPVLVEPGVGMVHTGLGFASDGVGG